MSHLLTAKELAGLLQIHLKTVYRWKERGLSPCSFPPQNVWDVLQSTNREVARVREFTLELLPVPARMNPHRLVQFIKQPNGDPEFPPQIPVSRTQ